MNCEWPGCRATSALPCSQRPRGPTVGDVETVQLNRDAWCLVSSLLPNRPTGAQVFRGHRLDDPMTTVVIKRLGPIALPADELSSWPELELMRGIRPPTEHVMPLLDWGTLQTANEFGDVQTTHCIVIPLGESMLQWEQSEHTQRERLAALLEVAQGVLELHQQGIIHRDLKPHNVIRVDGQWMVADFGISRVVPEDDADYTSTRAASRDMSWDYAAPEQLAGKRSTYATDVFSFAVMALELLTGRRPDEVRLGTVRPNSGSARLDDHLLRIITENDPARRRSMHALTVALARALGDDAWIVQHENLLNASTSSGELDRHYSVGRVEELVHQAWVELLTRSSGQEVADLAHTRVRGAHFPCGVWVSLSEIDRPWVEIQGQSTVYYAASIRFAHGVQVPGHRHHQHYGREESLWFIHTAPSAVRNYYPAGRYRLFVYEFGGHPDKTEFTPYALEPDAPSAAEHLAHEVGLGFSRTEIPATEEAIRHLVKRWASHLEAVSAEGRVKRAQMEPCRPADSPSTQT